MDETRTGRGMGGVLFEFVQICTDLFEFVQICTDEMRKSLGCNEFVI